jgi:hypothetical protein
VDASGIDAMVALVLSWAATGDHAIVVIDAGPDAAMRRENVKARLGAIGVSYDWLLMREDGSPLRDTALKAKMYDEISDSYKVVCAIETDWAAMIMWSKLKIPGFLVEIAP